ncbi:RidA family protein [Aliiglaciecola sp. M165]|uniref:RidA family protein n=1 Tax=Aliiglaciecola sp. M165 TaxID=2593649 RepID=UPI0011800427|nr:RidA family protein [Aliiglaciecola sp. M165]TRY31402.1 RidA family protein [Aliiglaciecola sp. M165]
MNEIETRAGLHQTENYSFAKRCGERLFVSGQVPLDSKNNLVGISDPFIQARQCLVNLKKVMNCHFFSFDDIKHITIYVAGNRDDLLKAWKAVTFMFPDGAPPSTLLGVSMLGYEHQMVEIDAKISKGCS